MHLSFFCKYLPKVSQGIPRDFSGDIFKTVPGKSAARDVPKHVPRNILCEISPEFFYIIFLGDICHKLPWGSLLSDIPKENPWRHLLGTCQEHICFLRDIPKKTCQLYHPLGNIPQKKLLKNGFWRWFSPTKIYFFGGMSPARFLEEYLQCQECLQSISCKIFVGGRVGNIVQRSLFGVYSQKSFFIKFQSLRRSMYQGSWGNTAPPLPKQCTNQF